jgi:protein-tyrosine-phosphatase
MAEGIFNSMIKKAGKEDLFISQSAGVYAMEGQNASKNAILALRDMDIDISSHKAQDVNFDLVEQSYLIISMTVEHKKELVRRFSSCTDKIFTFHQFAHDDLSRNVDDPYGLKLNQYKLCASEIFDGMKKIIEKVLK